MKFYLLFLVIFIYTSCGKPNSSTDTFHKISRASSAIKGTLETNIPYIESIVGVVKDNHIMCTGVFIEKNTILTAAHCIISSQNFEFIKYHTDYYSKKLPEKQKGKFIEANFKKHITNFAHDLGVYRGPGVKHAEVSDLDYTKKVKKVIMDETYFNYLINSYKNNADDYYKSTDVALVILSENENISPIKIVNKLTNFSKIFQTGYGNNGEFLGVKATTLLDVDKIDETRIYTHGKNIACAGDSGGPSIIKEDGEYFITAIASTGPENCSSSGKNMLTIFTSLDYKFLLQNGVRFE